MKKETGVLTRRQEALMNFLWEIDTPLTANEMAGKLKDEGWSAVTLFKTVQALDAEGYLMVTGIVSTGKTYARKMAPSMSKAQYYGSLLEKRNIKTEDIPEIVSFIIGKGKDDEEEKLAAVRDVLEKVLASMQQKMEKTTLEYSNPVMENYVVEGQLNIFNFISDPEKEKGSEPDEHSN